jgi:signal transduction histidine kinase/CheY-like chemotaxis protein/HPt (histidine-containing phosphotransfer) domain-containing protein
MERNLERLTLLVYTVHQVMMLGVEIYQHWPAWIMFAFAVALIIEWGLHTVSYASSHARQIVYLCMMEVCFFLYSMYREDMMGILIPFASIVVLVGLASYTDLVHITVGALLVLVVYHGFVVHSIHISGVENFLTYVIPILNVSLIQSVIYFWIQKRNQSAKKMQEVIRDLRMAERSKDDFLANVSHEIRTPINTINGMSEVILQEDVNKVVRDNVYNIQTAGRNLMSVVSDILDFSELQSGKMEIIEENYNITSTINDIINMSMAQKSRKRLELVVDCDPNLPRGLLGDEKKIRRVVMNLVNNAIKFTDEGGIGIEITFRKEFYGINLIITVQDSGIGMDAESVGRLFTSYNQVDMGKNRKNGGIGLGLAISKAIVQGMGGVITVRSRFGKGTSIRVTIPQKVTDERPIVEITNRENVNALEYTNMERITMRDVRDGYAKMLTSMGKRLGVASHMCRSFEELKRRAQHGDCSHIFIGFDDYMEHPDFYDEISKKAKVVVALDEANEGKISNHNIILIYKPVYVIPVTSILNGSVDRHKVNDRSHRQSFIAPDVKVLIVDDNVMNIRVVQGLLAKYKIRSVQALSGMESLEKIESKEFDLVFMDHMMPEMDGIETFHRIREKGGSYYTRVPIVALTANAVAGAREMFLDEGFDDFVEKPVDISVLERVLQRNLPDEKLIMTEELPEEEEKSGTFVVESGPVQEERRSENVFAVGDLDVEAGQTYCGGKDSYLEILKEYVQKGAENWDPIEALYEKQDWKNYTIAVHAVKSSMLAIGARPLSEMAKKLEAAGKEDNTAYILENHAAMMEEFKRVIGEIAESGYISVETGQEENAEELPTLSDEVFEQKAIELEDAMYDFDGVKMTAIVKELSGYAYHGTALKDPLAGVFHKIEMSDYMAAVEVVLKLKDKLKNEGREGA